MYRKPLGQTVIYGVGAVLPKVINYFFLKLFTRVLGQGEYSLYADMYAISFIVIGFLTFGLESTYFRFLYRKKTQDRQQVFSTGAIILFLIASSFLVFGLIFLRPIAYFAGYETHREYFLMFFLIIFCDTVCTLPMAWLRVHDMLVRYSFIRLLNVLVQSFVTLYLLVLLGDGRSDGSLEIWLSPLSFITIYTDQTGYIFYANMLASVTNLLCLSSLFFKIRLKKFKCSIALKMLAYGAPIMLGTLVFAINENLDKLLIKRWISDEINGAYAACYRIAAFMGLYATAFRLGIEPFFFKKAEDPDAKRTYTELTYLFTLLGVVFYVLVCANLELIADLMIDRKYHDALDIVPIVLMANLFLGIYTNLSIAYKVTDRPIVGTYISLIGALVTVLFNLLLLWPGSSFMICAWGTLASYGIMLGVSYVWGQRNYPVPYPSGRLIMHIVLAALVSYALLKKEEIFNIIGQFLYLTGVFFFERELINKIFKNHNESKNS
ncbi:MAG: lipopolysaccharide biosynthesis protein [Flavobacteriales bacterium AspAUS03]